MFVSSIENQQSFSMHVRDASSTSEDAWRKGGERAAAVNPLAAVNHGRNGLILEAIRTNDWSAYHNFQAKQHPAWYDKVNGEFKQNKLYYGNLIDVQHRSLKEAIQSGDVAEIAKRKANLDERIADFKNAPGEVPHVIAFITDPALAEQHGIGKPSNDWYNSPYNNPLATSQGRFEDQYWYENPYFVDHPKELTFAMEAVQQFRPEISNIATQINRGAYERSVASTSFTTKAVIKETEKKADLDKVRSNGIHDSNSLSEGTVQQADQVIKEAIVKQAASIIQQFSASTIVEQLFKQREQIEATTVTDRLLDRLAQSTE